MSLAALTSQVPSKRLVGHCPCTVFMLQKLDDTQQTMKRKVGRDQIGNQDQPQSLAITYLPGLYAGICEGVTVYKFTMAGVVNTQQYMYGRRGFCATENL